jgi:D-alanine-D-alanine ligase
VSGLTVALVFGGRSSEHSISCISAASVWEALEAAGHSVVPIAVTPGGAMVRYDQRPNDLRSVELPVVTDGSASVVFANDPRIHGVLIDGAPFRVDVVFPVLHGPWGEDGTIQGLLELAGIPYVGSGILASALCMDKLTLKQVLQASGIPVTPWVAVVGADWPSDRAALLADIAALAPVVFVKPSRAGSSVGITRVERRETGIGHDRAIADGFSADVAAAIEAARVHDPRVVVERAMVGAREIECAVRQDAQGLISASAPAEIHVREGFDFYDFDAKYLADGAELIVPADVDSATVAQVQELAMRCFLAAGCEGLARVDFFVQGHEIVVNEVNTMPGFTPISMFPRMWEASQVPYADLVDSLVAEAAARRTGLR